MILTPPLTIYFTYFKISLGKKMVKSEEETWANKHCMAESPLDLFWIQNSGYFLDTKITIFLDFDLKFLILSGCPSGGVYSSRRSNLFPQWTSFFFPTRNMYFRVKRPKTIKKKVNNMYI